ncbi:GNAT family N-acetyltransferase [Candidatus Fukatsuia symbiotica]|uniref:N-acetyltransferase n=1 Tax=Candidatus Fukatsuia symbiotica TaxID=1878942 RepID=A0A2U8I3L0_9GAMM|nr:GNAT family N-acetyltransferase [Candidatus Fukatsuia symbiotica]AWK13689.1 N-acetyltransferase [Candidatus Fukatsuia symbiotica]MEA9445519.1 GNAT family N-acetyltransferase [Candidatus Fukatsuia symbiotica]
MNYKNRTPLFSLYYQIENYFFTSISQRHHYVTDGACAYFTGVESSGLNLLIVNKKNCHMDIEAVLQRGIHFLHTTEYPFSIMIRSELIDIKIKNKLNKENFHTDDTSTAMQLNMENFPSSDLRNNDNIQCTDRCLTDWTTPLESAFASIPTVINQYQERHQAAIDAKKNLVHFSLYVKQQPVCSLTLSMQKDIARLDDIGTKVEFQGQGHASALMQHALRYAKSRSISRCFLDASTEGISLYKRTGFSTLFEYIIFHRERC